MNRPAFSAALYFLFIVGKENTKGRKQENKKDMI